MHYRRCLTTAATLVRRRLQPSFSHVIQHENDDTTSNPPAFGQSQSLTGYLQRRGFRNVTTGSSSSLAQPLGLGFSFQRYMSSTIGDGADKIAEIGYVTEVIGEDPVGAVASQVPAVSEVATAAADSAFPIAFLQYMIDGVHNLTGLNWWASIALTTVLIRTATVPVLINQLKATSKLNILRPRLEQLREEIKSSGMDSDAMAKGQQKMQQLFKEYGVTPFTPLKGILIQGPIFISFFLAIRNMTEKVPSFKTGGAFWFIDLTTPDSLLILPILTALSFWITVECNMQEGLEGNPVAGTMKKFSRILAIIGVPVMMGFPNALFGYWLTSNLFSLTYGLVIRRPAVKNLLGIPILPVDTAPQHGPSSCSTWKRDTAVTPEPSSTEASTEATRRTPRKISSASVLSQRLKSLEKKVKGRKNNKL